VLYSIDNRIGATARSGDINGEGARRVGGGADEP
jgi:hypothetical protein